MSMMREKGEFGCVESLSVAAVVLRGRTTGTAMSASGLVMVPAPEMLTGLSEEASKTDKSVEGQDIAPQKVIFVDC